MTFIVHDLLPNLSVHAVLPRLLEICPEIRVVVIRSIDSTRKAEDLSRTLRSFVAWNMKSPTEMCGPRLRA